MTTARAGGRVSLPLPCPDKDAKKHAAIPTLPRLCPDLSATVYGARAAAHYPQWRKNHGKTRTVGPSGPKIRRLILSRLYVEVDAAFYDLHAQSHFVKIRGDTQPGLR